MQEFRQLMGLATIGAEYSLGTGYEEAGIYGKDDRKEVNPLAYPFRTVGKIITEGKILDKNGTLIDIYTETCTATLVGDCHLLSARHCLYPQRKGELSKKYGSGAKMAVRETYFKDALGNLHEVTTTETHKGSKLSQDYSFLKVKDQPGKKLGFAPFLRQPSSYHKVGDTFTTVGFSSDINGGNSLTADDTAVKVTKEKDEKILQLKSDLFRGASGGPVFKLADNGVPYIAAIITRGPVKKNENGTLEQMHLSDSEKDSLSENVTTESFAKPLRKFIQANHCDD